MPQFKVRGEGSGSVVTANTLPQPKANYLKILSLYQHVLHRMWGHALATYFPGQEAQQDAARCVRECVRACVRERVCA